MQKTNNELKLKKKKKKHQTKSTELIGYGIGISHLLTSVYEF